MAVAVTDCSGYISKTFEFNKVMLLPEAKGAVVDKITLRYKKLRLVMGTIVLLCIEQELNDEYGKFVLGFRSLVLACVKLVENIGEG